MRLKQTFQLIENGWMEGQIRALRKSNVYKRYAWREVLGSVRGDGRT